MSEARFPLTLGVTSDVPHWPGDEAGPLAYAPYVREMRVWARLFERVEVCAPRADGPVRGTQVAYGARNVRWRPVGYSMADGRRGQLLRASQLPSMVRSVAGVVRDSDLVLLRSPGHLAIVGRVLANALGVRTLTKWAGPFFPHARERLTSRFERAHVRRGPDPALVYGPAERPHLVSFFPAGMTRDELGRARSLSRSNGRRWGPPWRILLVGRLHPDKHFDLALRGLGRLRARRPALAWTLRVVGDGPERDALRALATSLRIDDLTTFAGALDFGGVQREYAAAHLVLMPGTEEGWGKPINEAWAHGAVPVVADAGVGPWILREPDSGFTFAPTPEGLAATLEGLLARPERFEAVARRGAELGGSMSLERFEEELVGVLVGRCGIA